MTSEMQQGSVVSHNNDLLKAFGIGVEDLQANRAGRLGPAQRRNLLRSGFMNLAGSLLIGVLLCGILFGLANKPLVATQYIVSGILFLIVLIVGLRYFVQTQSAIADGRVERLVGQVRITSRGKAGWFLGIADHSFQIPVQPWHIRRDVVYHVYFVPRTHSIVAMEVITEGS